MMFLAFRSSDRLPVSRRRIREIIQSQPGITKTELCERTGLSWGTVYHHVRVLMRAGSVRAVKSLRRAYLYEMSAPPGHLPQMRLLRDEVPTRILEYVAAKPRSGIQDISSAMNMSRKIVRRYMTDLVACGLLTRSMDYRPKFEIAMPWISLGLRHPASREEMEGRDPLVLDRMRQP